MVVAFVLTALSFVGQWTSRLVEDASSSALWMMGSEVALWETFKVALWFL